MVNHEKYIVRHRYFKNAEVVLFVEKNLTNIRQHNGDGRAAENMARQIMVSTSTIYQVIYILKYASERILEEVLLDKISIKKTYNYLKNREKNDFINFALEIARSKLGLTK
jgi:IS30 family transposase